MNKLIFLITSLVFFNVYANQAEQIQQSEQQGRYMDALQLTLSEYTRLIATINLDQIIAEMKTDIDIIHQQVVIQKVEETLKWNTESVLDVAGGRLGIVEKGNSYSRHDVTKWIPGNAKEVINARRNAVANSQQLKRELQHYVLTNAVSLASIKILVAKAIQLSTKISQEDFILWFADLEKMYAMASFFEFTGQQVIATCDVHKYADSSSYSYYRNDYAILAISAGGILNESIGNVKSTTSIRNNAYDSKKCSFSAEILKLSADEVLHQQFLWIDHVLKSWYKQASVRFLVTKRVPENFTWGNPYYK